jgi:hypothetical protein
VKKIKDLSALQSCELWPTSSLQQLHSHNVLTVKELRNAEKRMSQATTLSRPEGQLLTGIRETIKNYGK